MISRTQKMSSEAFRLVTTRRPTKDYVSFAKSFPALIQAAGLCQAVAFAESRSVGQLLLEDLVGVLHAAGGVSAQSVEQYAGVVRSTRTILDYLRLSRLSLSAASWLKRAVESLDLQRKANAPTQDPAGADAAPNPGDGGRQ